MKKKFNISTISYKEYIKNLYNTLQTHIIENNVTRLKVSSRVLSFNNIDNIFWKKELD